MLRKIIPSTLIGRSIIIIFVPIIILVLLTSSVFYQTSWNIISKRLAESVVADINVLVKVIDDDLQEYATKIEQNEMKKCHKLSVVMLRNFIDGMRQLGKGRALEVDAGDG